MIALAILKIIGKALLIILLLVLLAIVLLLFTPFSYKVNAEYYNTLKAKVRFHDFLRFLSVRFDYDAGADFSVYILWGKVKVYPRGPKKAKEQRPKQSRKKNSKIFDENFTEREVSKEEYEEYKGKLYSENKVQEEVISTSEKIDEETSKKAKKKVKKEKKSRPPILDLLKEIMKEEYSAGRKIILDKILKIIKHIWPDIKEADITYSTGEPDTTGYATAVLSMMPFIYGRNKSFNPDFSSEKPYVKGYIIIDGRLFLYYVLYIVISLFTNKDSRKVIMKFIKG